MPDYSADAAEARADLLEDGGLFKVRVYKDIDYDESTGETIRTHVDTMVPGAFFDFFFGSVPIAGTEIEKGDKRLYLAADVAVEQGNTQIEIDSEWWQVVGKREVKPDGATVIIYDLHLRK